MSADGMSPAISTQQPEPLDKMNNQNLSPPINPADPNQKESQSSKKRKMEEEESNRRDNKKSDSPGHTSSTTRSLDQLRDNRYDALSKGPFIVFITFRDESTDSQGEKGPQKNIANLHPMSIGMQLRNKDKTIRRIKRIGANLIQITYNHYDEANELVDKQRDWLDPKWFAYIPDFKVTRSGIGKGIREDLSEEQIRHGLDWEGKEVVITKIERFTRTKTVNGERQRVPSGTVKFTFKGSYLPEELIIYRNSIKIEPFISNLRKCDKCRRIGHQSWNCRGKARWHQCGDPHETNSCESTNIRCASCGGPHKSFDENCERVQYAKMVNTVSAYLNIGNQEAKKKIHDNHLTTLKNTKIW